MQIKNLYLKRYIFAMDLQTKNTPFILVVKFDNGIKTESDKVMSEKQWLKKLGLVQIKKKYR